MTARFYLLVMAVVFLSTPVFCQTAEDYYRAGLQMMEAKDIKKAYRYFAAALKLDPNHDRAYRRVGMIFLELNQEAQARDLFQRSLEKHPQEPSLAYYLSGEKEPGGARAKDGGRSYFVLKVGENFSRIISTESSFGMRSGTGFGAFYSYRFSPRWALQSGLWFLPKGAKDATSIHILYDLKYFEIPLTIQCFFRRGGFTNFYLGPGFSFFHSGKLQVKNQGVLVFEDTKLDFMKSFSTDMVFGMDIAVHPFLSITWEATYGLTSMFDFGDAKSITFLTGGGLRF